MRIPQKNSPSGPGTFRTFWAFFFPLPLGSGKLLLLVWVERKQPSSLHFSMQEIGAFSCQSGAFYLYQWAGISILAMLWECTVYSVSIPHGPRSTRAVFLSVTSPHIYLVNSLMKAVPKLLSIRWPDALWMWKSSDILSYILGLFFIGFATPNIWDEHTSIKMVKAKSEEGPVKWQHT